MKTTRATYNIDPKRCVACGGVISFEKRSNKYCGHSCAASVTNSNRVLKHNPDWHRPIVVCPGCYGPHQNATYCSMKCRNNHTLMRFRAGEISDRGTLGKLLRQLHGNKCQSCKNSEWLGQPLPLEVDHTSGDASDNRPANLRLVCPNCHSITPSWKGRNKGNGRKSKGLPTN